MDRLEAMSVLVAAVETGSLSAAGRRLGIPLPTVSRKITDLESHLNTRLLVRSTRKLALTEAGIAYVAASKRILEQVGDAERVATGEYITPKGELIVGAPIVFGRLHVLPILNEFLATFPEISARLLLSDRNADLLGDHIDLALRIGLLTDSTIVATRVGFVRRVVCGSPAYFAGHGVPKSPDDLAAHSAITFEIPDSATAWEFTDPKVKRRQTVSIRSRLTVTTAEAAVDAAIAGIGITRLLSYQVAGAVNSGQLQIVLSDFEAEPSPVSLIHASQSLLPLKTRSFLDFATSRLRKRLTNPISQQRRGRQL